MRLTYPTSDDKLDNMNEVCLLFQRYQVLCATLMLCEWYLDINATCVHIRCVATKCMLCEGDVCLDVGMIRVWLSVICY